MNKFNVIVNAITTLFFFSEVTEMHLMCVLSKFYVFVFI